ncbi:MAG: hypothetical protein KC444_07530 [Nitrosopumilus sp.]|nr:hypothetical protein [Nitrosopumilus sp.]
MEKPHFSQYADSQIQLVDQNTSESKTMTKRYQMVAKYDDHLVILETDPHPNHVRKIIKIET